METNNKKLIAVSQWNRYHDFPTVGALRNLIFFANKNGIDKCIKKIGGRRYIEESTIFEWVDERIFVKKTLQKVELQRKQLKHTLKMGI